MTYTEKNKETAGHLIPVFGVTYDVTQPHELQNAIEAATKELTQASEYKKQAERYQSRCFRLWQYLKTFEMEVCHE